MTSGARRVARPIQDDDHLNHPFLPRQPTAILTRRSSCGAGGMGPAKIRRGDSFPFVDVQQHTGPGVSSCPRRQVLLSKADRLPDRCVEALRDHES